MGLLPPIVLFIMPSWLEQTHMPGHCGKMTVIRRLTSHRGYVAEKPHKSM